MVISGGLPIIRSIFPTSEGPVVAPKLCRLVKGVLKPHDIYHNLLFLTCSPGVDDEFGHLEGASFHQPFTGDFNLAGIANFRLSHHDLKGAVGDMLAAFLDAHDVLPNLLGGEGDPWGGGETEGEMKGEQDKGEGRLGGSWQPQGFTKARSSFLKQHGLPGRKGRGLPENSGK